GPFRGAEARLGRLRERPHPEMLAAGDAPAGVVSITFALQWPAESVDEQSAAGRRVGGDYRHAGAKENVHATSLGNAGSPPAGSRTAAGCAAGPGHTGRVCGWPGPHRPGVRLATATPAGQARNQVPGHDLPFQRRFSGVPALAATVG